MLVITWAFQEGCFKHIEVKEHDKPSEMQVGRRLEIDGEEYEDIDEILARFISPMNEFVENILMYDKYYNVSNVLPFHSPSSQMSDILDSGNKGASGSCSS